MTQPENKWWWLPGVLFALAGLLFIVTAGVWGMEEVWIPVGAAFIVVSAFAIHRSKPRSEADQPHVTGSSVAVGK